jgi:hypothetical protein
MDRPLYAHISALVGPDHRPKLPKLVFVMLRGGLEVLDNELPFEQVCEAAEGEGGAHRASLGRLLP